MVNSSAIHTILSNRRYATTGLGRRQNLPINALSLLVRDPAVVPLVAVIHDLFRSIFRAGANRHILSAAIAGHPVIQSSRQTRRLSSSILPSASRPPHLVSVWSAGSVGGHAQAASLLAIGARDLPCEEICSREHCPVTCPSSRTSHTGHSP